MGKRGQTIKKSDFSKNSSMKISDKSGGFLTNQANNTSDTSSKKINHTYRSTILGQAIGKLLENKSKSNISVQKMEKSKKSSLNKILETTRTKNSSNQSRQILTAMSMPMLKM